MTLPQPTAFLALTRGYDGECPAAEGASPTLNNVSVASFGPTHVRHTSARSKRRTRARASRWARPQQDCVCYKPTGRLFAYREYRAGDRSAADHCYHLMKGDQLIPPEPRIPTCAGGSKSEGQWRREFAARGTVNGVRVAGIPIHGSAKPETQVVEVGINRVFAAFALNQILVFDDLHGFLDELQSYSRELDEMGEPTEKIEAKETFHLLDAVRYVISYLHMDKPKGGFSGSPVARKGLQNRSSKTSLP